jgi:hypothetical protein
MHCCFLGGTCRLDLDFPILDARERQKRVRHASMGDQRLGMG